MKRKILAQALRKDDVVIWETNWGISYLKVVSCSPSPKHENCMKLEYHKHCNTATIETMHLSKTWKLSLLNRSV